MLRIIDRYLIREVLPPLFLGLLVFTFVLELPPIIQQGERLIAKGTSWTVVVQVLITLVPQALGITIPMALLIGLLIAFGRLSGDREVVALQACGISLDRLLVPVGVLALVATGATLYTMIVLVPAANQAFREIAFNIVGTRAETEIKPRVFFEDFPNLVLYVEETDGTGWRDVFAADTSKVEEPVVYVADRGRVLLDRVQRTVQLILEDGTSHRVSVKEPQKYEMSRFKTLVLSVNPDTVFPRGGLLKGDQEMTITELRVRMLELERQGQRTHNQVIAINQKFSIPVACLVFGLIGLSLGVTNRRDGKLASFVQGTLVLFVYYVIMYMGRALAKGALIPAWSAMWLPNIILGAVGVFFFLRRGRSTEGTLRIEIPFLRRRPQVESTPGVAVAARSTGNRVVVVVRVPHLPLPRPSILDWYVAKQCGKIVAIAGLALLGLFYISSFIDLSEKLFKGTATGTSILKFLWFATPQFVYYIIPMAVLIGGLVTIGALTKNSELVVMKACGISLYRASAPLLILAVLSSATLFGLEERVLAYSNRRAEEINRMIRGRPLTGTFDVLNRKWIVSRSGSIYHYVYFDSERRELNQLSVYEFNPKGSDLRRRSYYHRAVAASDNEPKWKGTHGWAYRSRNRPEARSQVLLVRSPRHRARAAGLFRDGTARRRPDELCGAQPVRDRTSGERL